MPQVARPASDVSVGGWTTDAGGTINLFQRIDEASASDADFVRADPTINGDAYVIGMQPLVDPGINTGHTVRYRYQKDSSGGDTVDLDVILQAPDGWDVHTEAHDDISSTITADEFTLTGAEVDEFRTHGGHAMPQPKLVQRSRQTITTNTGVTYTTSPTTLLCDIRRPSTGGPFPVVVMVVDGGWQGNTFITAEDEAIRLAQEEGFAVITIGLRVAPANIAPAPMEDCADLIDFIVANAATYNLDPNNIAAMGGSGGGHVATFLAFGTYLTAGQFARVKCVAAASPPCDLRTMDDDGADPVSTGYTEDFLGVTEAASPSTWEFFSPTFRVGSTTKPILLVNSVGDSIPPAQSIRLATVLAANGIEHRQLTFSGSLHGWSLIPDPLPWAEIVTWLHRYLG